MKKLLTLVFIIAGTILSFAQSLVEPLENVGLLWFPKNHECVIIDMEGNTIEGKIVSGKAIDSSPGSITVLDKEGNKVKLKAEQIKSAKVKASDLIKFSKGIENMGSVQEITNADWKEIIDSEYLYYVRALAPKKKKDKSRIYMVLNPGFDSKIQILHNPWGNESGGLGVGGVKLTGGKEKSYLIVKNGQKSFKIKKGDYKKQFKDIYGDCPAILATFTGKIKLADLAGHVFAYDQICK